jgi:hypothetical protein
MKKTLVLLTFSYLISSIANCQLLTNPSLTVEDFEIALTNSDHIEKILKEHDFKHSTLGAHKFNAPGAIINPLIPDLQVLKSENWEPVTQKDQDIFKVIMYEWAPDHSPHPQVIRTIHLMVYQNSKNNDKITDFLEKIKNKYPNISQRYFRNTELYRNEGKPLNVFTNNSKIEVRTETTETSYGSFYIVDFDLIK